MKYIRLFVCIILFACFQLVSTTAFAQSDENNIYAEIERQVEFAWAQISDLHISAQNDRNTIILDSVIADINANNDIAFVIVSGDVTEMGDYASLTVAKKKLDKLTCPYYVIPGNHDQRWTESAATDFNKVFGDDKFRLQMNGLFFVGISSGPVFKAGDGHITPEDLAWMKRQLKNIGKKSPVFLVTHHPLRTGDVDNWWELTDIARKYNIQYVLSGHYHRNFLNNYDDIPGLICRSTQRNDEGKVGYLIYKKFGNTIEVYNKQLSEVEEQFTEIALMQRVYVEGNQQQFPRASYEMNDHYKHIKNIWKKSHTNAIYTAPCHNGNKIYFADDRGIIYCYSADKGKELWQYAIQNRIVSSPVIDNSRIYVGSVDGYLYCLSCEDGKLIWRYRANATIFTTPQLSDGIVYFAAGKSLMAVNADNGDEIWSYKINGFQQTQPVVTDNSVIFTAWDNKVYALDRQNGELRWAWSDNKESTNYTTPNVTPKAVGENLFVVSREGWLTALDCYNGIMKWQDKARKVIASIGCDNGMIYSRMGNDSVFAYQVNTDNIERAWSESIGYKHDNNPCSMVVYDKRLYIATQHGEIICVAKENGKVVWRHKIGNALVNDVMPLKANDVVVTSTDGSIVRFGEKR